MASGSAIIMDQSTSKASFSDRDFRDALSTFATGVTIVTATDADGVPIGMTVSSFNSVSVDPPLVLWSVTKSALSADAFYAARHFAIHILSSDQVEISGKFAKPGTDKFAGVEFLRSDENVPLIKGACCRLDCTQWAVYEGGDHWIIVGQVENIERQNNEPLVFSGGSYATAAPIRPTGQAPKDASKDSSPIDGLLIYNLARAYHQLSGKYHAAVREVGLSVPEWRILASLQGSVSRSLDELAARTFVEPWALEDMVHRLEKEGLAHTDRNGPSVTITGTAEGHSRIEHIFVLGERLEKEALGHSKEGHGRDEQRLEGLIQSLQSVIEHTDQ